MRFLKRSAEFFLCVFVGYFGYICIELLVRGYSYPLMGILGAIGFYAVGQFNESRNIGLIWQGLMGMFFITAMELVSGLMLRHFGIRMWDYSNQWMNYKGVICPLFSFCWFFLSLAIVFVDDWIRLWIFKEKRKKYKLW